MKFFRYRDKLVAQKLPQKQNVNGAQFTKKSLNALKIKGFRKLENCLLIRVSSLTLAR